MNENKFLNMILGQVKKAVPPKIQLLIGGAIAFGLGICSFLETLGYLPEGVATTIASYQDTLMYIAAGFGVTGGGIMVADQQTEVRELRRSMDEVTRSIRNLPNFPKQ